MNKPQYLIVHHTGGTDLNPMADSSNFTFEQCNALHKARFNFISHLGYYVGYHYYISKDGTIRQARLDTDEGAHTIGYNEKSIGICLAGNFDATLPTPAQVAALRGLLLSKSKVYNITKERIVPHRAFAVKTCYGKRLPDDWARKLLDNTMYKLALVNVDFADAELPKFIDALKAEVSRLSGGLFPLDVTWIDFPKTDALQNITPVPPAGGNTVMKLEYITKTINEAKVTGFHTVGLVYHLPIKFVAGPEMIPNLAACRPAAYGGVEGQQMLSAWFWNKADLPDEQSCIPGWNWAIIHELCHSIFFRLNAMGIYERDTTHDGNQGDFSDEFAIFNKYIPQLTGASPVPVPPTPTPVPPTPTYPMIDFRKGDKEGNIFMEGKDGKWNWFEEYSIYENFAKFGKLTTMPQAQMDALPKGTAIAFVVADLK